MGEFNVTIHGIDFLGLLEIIDNINRRYIRITLNNIENVWKDNTLSNDAKYKLIRKYVLDGFNEHSRTMLRALFDNEEDK